MMFQSVTSKTNKVQVVGKLPVGDREVNFKLHVQVLIVDSLGSAASREFDLKVCTQIHCYCLSSARHARRHTSTNADTHERGSHP